MDLVFLARVGRPHGVDGEFYVDRIALSADELRTVRAVEWRGTGGARRSLVIAAVRATHDRLLVRISGVSTREAAAELTNGALWGDSARLPDPGPGVAYTFQLVGLRVVDVSGRELGVLRDVQTSTAQPLYVVEREGREHLYPGIEPFVKKVDLASGVITMELPAGFEDLNP
jgi:16S rRNA processing protein RimM